MPHAIHIIQALSLSAVAVVLFIAARPQVTHNTGGRVLAFLGFFILPVLATLGGTDLHMKGATSTQFCLSCHEMQKFGESLHIADTDYIPAVHYQNGFVPRDHACYTCHTQYTMFGGVRAKLRGLRHVYVHYLGTPPAPKDIKLYTPYNNRECFHCHAGARKYEQVEEHQDERKAITSGKLSCKECHDRIHGIDELKDLERWKPKKDDEKSEQDGGDE